MKEKLNVLFCAFGSITDFSVQQNGYVKVAKQLDIKPTTVEMLLVRLKKYGYDVQRLVGKRRRPDRVRKLIGSAELEKQLVSKECLTKHAHLSLPQRAALFEQEYGVQVSADRIKYMYKVHGVKYKFTKRTLSSAKHPPELLEEMRRAFAVRLQTMINDNVPILYFDEYVAYYHLRLFVSGLLSTPN